MDERADAGAEQQEPEHATEQPKRILERNLHGLPLLLPERALELFPRQTVFAPAAHADALHLALEAGLVQHESHENGEEKREHGVDQRRLDAEEREHQRQDGRVQDRRRQQERDRSTERRAALEQADEHGDRRAGTKRRDRAEQRTENAADAFLRRRQHVLDTLFRHIHLQQGDDEADADEQPDKLFHQHHERLPGRDEIFYRKHHAHSLSYLKHR